MHALAIERLFYYTEGMSWLNRFWRWIHPLQSQQVLILAIDSWHARHLDQLAANSDTSRRQVAEGLLKTALIDQQVAQTQLSRWRGLTPRQQQVAALACLNFTNRQIAARLKISPQTVKTHMRNLLHRFELQTKSELRQALADWDFSAWV